MTDTLTSLDKSLSTLINGATEKGTALVDFLYAQAPEVIQQLLLWHGVESAAKCLFGLFFIIGMPLILIKLTPSYKRFFEREVDKDSMNHPGFIVPVVIACFLTLIPCQIAGWNSINLTWLKIWIAPKVYLLEYVAQLGK